VWHENVKNKKRKMESKNVKKKRTKMKLLPRVKFGSRDNTANCLTNVPRGEVEYGGFSKVQ